MQFAIISTGGTQYLVKEKDTIRVATLKGKQDAQLNFTEVLCMGDTEGTKVVLGAPTISGAKVTAKIVRHARAPKVRVVHYKNKTRHKTERGHRQAFTQVRITGISA